MDNYYVPQTKIDWKSNDAISQFQLWKKEVNRIINGPLATKSNAVKVNHIFIWAGAHAESLIEARQREDPNLNVTTPEGLLTALARCITYETMYREAREKFYTVHQLPNENTATYFARISDLHRQAEFPDNTDFLITDKLIHGCANQSCKQKLMTKGKDVTISACLESMRRFEARAASMEDCGNPGTKTEPSTDHHVDAQYSQGRTLRRRTPADKCQWCGGQRHNRQQCPAKDKTCKGCSRIGHFERVCRQKRSQQNAVDVAEYSDHASEDYDMGIVHLDRIQHHQPREVLTKVSFHTAGLIHEREGKVDTGAMASCMPRGLLPSLQIKTSDLKPSKAVLRGISGINLRNQGTLMVHVACNGKEGLTEFYVTEHGREIILGLPFCRQFDLITMADACYQRQVSCSMEAVHITEESSINYEPLKKKWKKHLPLGKQTGDALKDLKLIFPTMFDGSVGLFDGEVDLSLSPDAQPVQLAPRAVPQSILPELKAQLDKMESEGIIRPCPEVTDWVHNLVTVIKKDGSLRVCLDPRNLNKYLVRSVHHTASWEDVQHSFRHGRLFSTLDAKSGYWTQKLSHNSQLLTAFNTPFQKYCFQRLPFGLSVSAEIFCQKMDAALQGIPGTFPCADDVKIQGSTEERHDIHLLETVEAALKAGIKFNPDKCTVKKNSIEYFGRIVSPQGVKADPKKVEAVVNLAAPKDKQELQSFLGTVNFMATFIPNLAQQTNAMRTLLKKGVRYIWTADMQQEFEAIKRSIARDITLTHYDPAKPVIIETDASLKGLGAVLIQDSRPVRFLSKSLTAAEKDYANIERELLAVLFACERLHVYTFGRKVSIHTDHKPLAAIITKPISQAPPRLQRMLLRLRRYDIDIKYVGANHVLVSDTLSRLIKEDTAPAVPGLDVHIAQILKIRANRLQTIQTETKNDPELSQLIKFILQGWPKSMQDVPVDLHPYWSLRDELAVIDGVVLKGQRVIIPTSLREDTLKRLHDAHQGLSSTLHRARQTVYWPGIHHDVTRIIEMCRPCQTHARTKPRTSQRQMQASRPMEIVAADLMATKHGNFLVTIDYFSGFLTADRLPSITSQAVMTALMKNFQKFGLVQMLLTDNGPCFASEAFKKFCEEMEVQHITSSPHYHQSNGRVERAIQTVRQLFNKCSTHEEFTLGLIAYHDTPITDTLPGPAELMFGRRINSRLSPLRAPSALSTDQKMELSERRAAHLKSPSQQRALSPHQPLWIQDPSSRKWHPGFAQQPDDAPHSWWVRDSHNDRTIRRNVHDLRPRATSAQDQLPMASDETPQPPPLPDMDQPPAAASSSPPVVPQGIQTRSGLVLGQRR